MTTPADKIRNFLDERQDEPPEAPSSTDKLNEFISRQGAAPEGLVEGTRGPGLLGGIGRVLGRVAGPIGGFFGRESLIEVPGVSPAIRKGLEAFPAGTEAVTGIIGAERALGERLGIPGRALDPLNIGSDIFLRPETQQQGPGQLFNQLVEEQGERPFAQQLALAAATDPTLVAPFGLLRGAGNFGRASRLTRAVPADPFLRAATPATQRIGETLGTGGTTAAVGRMRLAQTGQRAGSGAAGVPDVAPRPSAVRQTFTQEGDEALLFAAGEQNRLDPTRAVREVAEPPVTQRQGGRNLAAEIKASQETLHTNFEKGPTGIGGGDPPAPRAASAAIPEGDPLLQKVIGAIRGATRLGISRREMVAEFRGRQFARGMSAQVNVPVLERDVRFRRAQAGQESDLPDITKLQIEFGPGEFEGLVQRIYDSPRIRQGTYDPFTTANAFKQLFGPLGGKLPNPSELAMLERVFGREFVSAILSKRGLGAKTWDEFLQAWNLPRAFMATADLSASLRQAAPLGLGNKRRYKDAFREQLRAFISEKSAEEAQDVLERHPRFTEYTRKRGIEDPRKGRRLQLTTFDRSANFTQREESFMSRWSQNIPIVRNAERAYVTMLNQLRFNVMDDMVKQSEKALGRTLREQELDHIASFINYATGRGPLGPAEAAAPFLNGMFFAPRFATSRFALPARFIGETVQAISPTGISEAVSERTGGTISATNRTASRKMAADLALYVGTGMAILKMLEMGGVGEVSANPTSSDFGKLKLGKTRIDIWAGFTQVARLVAQLYTGEGTSTTTGEQFPLSSEFIFGQERQGLEDVQIKRELPSRGSALGRFLRGKLSPVAGELADQFTGEDFLGDEATPGRFTEASRKNPFFENLVPLFVQDILDAVMEEGGTSGLKAIPSFFGAGATTYTSDLDKAAETNFDRPFRELDEQEQEIVRDSLRKVRREKQLEKVRKNQP